jgi:hypothetical protein
MIQKLQHACDIIRRTLKGNTQKGYAMNMLPRDGRSCAAIWKRMLENKKKGHAKIKKKQHKCDS